MDYIEAWLSSLSVNLYNNMLNLLVLCSKTFVDTLCGVGAQAELILYDGKTHTDLFLQVCIHCILPVQLSYVHWLM